MKARLQKERIRLDLAAPFGELDPVQGVLLVQTDHYFSGLSLMVMIAIHVSASAGLSRAYALV